MNLPLTNWRVRVEFGVYVANIVVKARHHEEAEREARLEVENMKRATDKKLTITDMTTTELLLP
jgi:hypothetical protein